MIGRLVTGAAWFLGVVIGALYFVYDRAAAGVGASWRWISGDGSSAKIVRRVADAFVMASIGAVVFIFAIRLAVASGPTPYTSRLESIETSQAEILNKVSAPLICATPVKTVPVKVPAVATKKKQR